MCQLNSTFISSLKYLHCTVFKSIHAFSWEFFSLHGVMLRHEIHVQIYLRIEMDKYENIDYICLVKDVTHSARKQFAHPWLQMLCIYDLFYLYSATLVSGNQVSKEFGQPFQCIRHWRTFFTVLRFNIAPISYSVFSSTWTLCNSLE